MKRIKNEPALVNQVIGLLSLVVIIGGLFNVDIEPLQKWLDVPSNAAGLVSLIVSIVGVVSSLVTRAKVSPV